MKFKTHALGRGRWTGWIFPVQRGYLLKCCDCGLVHEMDFKVDDKGRVRYRARRTKGK